MFRFGFAFAAGMLLATSALSDDRTGLLDEFAALLGFANGASIPDDTGGPIGPATRSGPGAYDLNFPSGSKESFEASEVGSCVLQARLEGGGNVTAIVRVDFNRVSAITLTDDPTTTGPVSAFKLSFEGTGDIVQVSYDGTTFHKSLPETTIVTSLHHEDLQAAADAMRRACPGV